VGGPKQNPQNLKCEIPYLSLQDSNTIQGANHEKQEK